ncbi:hypothetical protein Pmani_038584 [Petrolisthes manimaculis]|uniref:Uncharacterized protein n=1 Tax=Petrolisthes manimaculis TaxID=1843537 RepID=A0AAE1NGM6_9EUCA|nr:hypothetical protein Pmani_038584 [Petrolisthes manimaculis]
MENFEKNHQNLEYRSVFPHIFGESGSGILEQNTRWGGGGRKQPSAIHHIHHIHLYLLAARTSGVTAVMLRCLPHATVHRWLPPP